MRELIERRWCDSCFAEDQAKVPAEHTFTVGAVAGESRPLLKVLELCERHSKLVVQLQELMAETGQTPDLQAKPAPPTARDWRCPVCTSELPRNQAVVHVWRHHRADRRPELHGVCPTCHEPQENGAGLAAHRRITHGFDALADALSGVKGYRAH